MLIPIDDLSDSRLDDFFRLTDVALRKKIETDRGVYIAEGAKVIERALAAGHHPRSFVLTERWVESTQEIASRYGADVPIFVVPDEQMTVLTGFHVHRGALAAMDRPLLPDPVSFLDKASGYRRIVILENLVNHTNVGAVFRSVAAIGFDAVLVTDTCADPLYRRSVKVSMGTVFQVPWTKLHTWPRSAGLLKDHGWISASLALRKDALTLDEFSALDCVRDPQSRLAIVLGTEGDGLSQETINVTDYRVVIPMAGGVDSLNVAAAGAVAAWELRVR